MVKIYKCKIINIIENLSDFSWKEWIYSSDLSITENSDCLVFDPDCVCESEIISKNKLQEIISIHDLEGIISNLENQNQSLSINNIIISINYFLENDSYIDYS